MGPPYSVREAGCMRTKTVTTGRRTPILGALAAVSTLLLGGCGVIAPGLMDGGTVTTVGAVTFDRPLVIPPLAESTIDSDGTRRFSLDAAESSTEFRTGAETPTWG